MGNNTIVLILSNEKYLNWQNPNKVTNYIKENWEFVETIGAFSAYKRR